LDKAVEHLEKSQSLYPENFDAQVFLACALRKKQQRKEAAEIIDAVLKKDPTSFCALAEHYFIATESNDKVALKGARERLRKVLRGEVQSYLEMSIDYARFGLYDEGIKILTLYLDDCPDSQHQFPLLHYYLGYYYEKVGKISDSRNNYRRGGEMAPHFVFPHRLESDIILRRVLEVDPEDKKAMYYLGNLLCSKGRTDEAVKLWEKAANMGTQFSVVHRNLGRAYWRALCQPDMAIREYERAIECDRLDYKLYYELDELYTAYALNEKRHDLMRRIPEELLGNDMIGERMAAYYTDVFDFDRALEILHGIKFYPWEAYTEGRRIYEDACIGKAILHFTKGQANEAIGSLGEAMKYPRNLGVGEPAKKNHAEALFRMGLAYESMDDGKTAKSLYQKAVEEEHTERSALCYYQARALQCLGKKGEASAVLNELFTPGDAGSDEASNLYLRGLACKGTGDGVKALHYFKNALALNPAHRRSHWEVTGFSGKW
jgi:tetratricopeptide (TPR) repeat protein